MCSVELNTGIMAACLPALRPLFTSFLETANNIKTNGLRHTVLGGSNARHRYQLQKEDTKMSPLPTRSAIRDKQGYGVMVSGGGRTIYEERNADFGPMSKLEQSITENDSGSEENILPTQIKGRHRVHMPPPQVQRERPRGILRTTGVMVSR